MNPLVAEIEIVTYRASIFVYFIFRTVIDSEWHERVDYHKSINPETSAARRRHGGRSCESIFLHKSRNKWENNDIGHPRMSGVLDRVTGYVGFVSKYRRWGMCRCWECLKEIFLKNDISCQQNCRQNTPASHPIYLLAKNTC